VWWIVPLSLGQYLIIMASRMNVRDESNAPLAFLLIFWRSIALARSYALYPWIEETEDCCYCVDSEPVLLGT